MYLWGKPITSLFDRMRLGYPLPYSINTVRHSATRFDVSSPPLMDRASAEWTSISISHDITYVAIGILRLAPENYSFSVGSTLEYYK
jgi:hypothetical protein